MSLEDYRRVMRADMAANEGYPKSQLVLGMFRTVQLIRSRRDCSQVAQLFYAPLNMVYKIVSEWILGIELPASTRCGAGLRLRHGVGLVVNPHAIIGANVLIRHNVTLGNRRASEDCPTIEDEVEIGVGVVIIGDITVGKGARIGPNVVIFRDVPPGATVYSAEPSSR